MSIIPRERLELVERLYLDGVPDRQIRARVKARFKVGNGAAKRYLARVKAKLAAIAAAVDPDAARAQVEGMLLKTFKAAQIPNMNTGQPNAGAMATAAQRLAELRGVLAPQRFEHSIRGAVPLDGLSDEALAALDAAARKSKP